MKILTASAADTAEIYRIMTQARSLAPDPGWYCTDSEDYIREHIVNPDAGIVFKAVEQDCLAAFFIIHFPGNTPDSPGNFLKMATGLRLPHKSTEGFPAMSCINPWSDPPLLPVPGIIRPLFLYI